MTRSSCCRSNPGRQPSETGGACRPGNPAGLRAGGARRRSLRWVLGVASWRVTDILLTGLSCLVADMEPVGSIDHREDRNLTTGLAGVGTGPRYIRSEGQPAGMRTRITDRSTQTPASISNVQQPLTRRPPDPKQPRSIETPIASTMPPPPKYVPFRPIFLFDTRICNELLSVCRSTARGVGGVEFGQGRQGLLPAEVGGDLTRRGLLPTGRYRHRDLARQRRQRPGSGRRRFDRGVGAPVRRTAPRHRGAAGSEPA